VILKEETPGGIRHARFVAVFKDKGLSQTEFGKLIGVKQGNISKMLSGEREVGEAILHRLVTKLNVNREWLDTGEGEMFVEAKKHYGDTGSPYYDVDFVGGFDLVMDDNTVNPEYMIDLPPYNQPGVMWCNLYGKSMEPFIMSGDRIAIKEISVEDVLFGKPYGLVTISGLRTVKWIVRSPEQGCYRLVPENKDPKFGDYQDIRVEDIRKVFLVMGAVRAF
jgi:transcriptional regulator with XRE-family HTH domain